MKVKIKTLTPIHIGTGKKLGSLEFLDNKRINYDRLFELIAEEKQEKFFEWIDQNPSITANEIIKRFQLNKAKVLNKCGLYSISGSFQQNLNEGIKDSNNEFFIPGSSLKGSLRTSLMYKVLLNSLNKTFLFNFLDELIKEAYRVKNDLKKIKDLLKKADDELERKVFICGVQKEKNNKTEIIYDDQKYDLLKLVRISDTSSISTYDNGEISELQVYALKDNKPHKLKIRDKFTVVPIYVESIKEYVELEFDISIDVEFLKRAQKELNNLNSDFGKKYFIGIEQKLKDLFDIDIKNDPDFSEEKIINSIIKAWVEFGKVVSDIEKVWVGSIVNKSNVNINSLNKLYNSENKVKVGFGSGFSGMTILPLLLKDNNLKNKAYTFYKAVGIGFHKSTNTPLNINEFPFTRKYSNNQNIYDGFGWVEILNGNEQSEVSDTDERVNKPAERPANTVIAEIIDDKSKPPKVKILEGDHANKETILPNIRLEGLGLSKGSKVYVKLNFDKKNLQKAELKGKV
ncbi:MAG: CRISPR-associated protein, Csm5 family [Ignavibacteriae bacterium]|nr:MAG: CRISPR-associated protein, Csm5 family [Ignavibacteriota bacterium]